MNQADIMSVAHNEWVRLVVGMTPPGRRYEASSSTAVRDRAVLLTLAYLAGEDGSVRVSLMVVNAVTLYPVKQVRVSVKTWKERGVLVVQPGVHGPNRYRLVREALTRCQLTAMDAASGSLDVLGQLGVDVRAVNAVRLAGIHSMDELGERVSAFRQLASGQRARGFHWFLNTRGLGARTGQTVLDAYDVWASANGAAE